MEVDIKEAELRAKVGLAKEPTAIRIVVTPDTMILIQGLKVHGMGYCPSTANCL